MDRDQFMSVLAEDGSETRPVFYTRHLLPISPERSANSARNVKRTC